MSALHGILVLEVAGGLRGSYCGKTLRDWGADVLKVELPGTARPGWARAWLDVGKNYVSLDWRVAEGHALLDRLAARADVLVDDGAASVGHEPAGFLDVLRKRHPRLVHTSITDLGRGGPWEARPTTDLTVAALSGICMINGVAGRLPLREPGNQTAILAGLVGFFGTLVALENRSVTGRGQLVDVSALEAVVNVLSPSVLQLGYLGHGPERHPSASGFLFDCADGQVSIILSADRSWQTLCDVWQVSLDAADDRFATQAARRQNIGAIRAALAPILRVKRRAEVFEELSLVRVPCGMLLSPAELLNDPHLAARGAFVAIDAESGGDARRVPWPGFRLLGIADTTTVPSQLPQDVRALLATAGRG